MTAVAEPVAATQTPRKGTDPLSLLGIGLIVALLLAGAVAGAVGEWRDVMAAMVHPVFHLGTVATSWLEVIGFATGFLTVYLVVKDHVANWPIGIANTMALCALFFDAGLYADGGLQVVYILLGFYGWWAWLWDGRRGTQRAELRLSRTTLRQWAVLAAAVVSITLFLWWLLATQTESVVPFWDALTTAISLAATWGQARKKVESWFLWITADLIYIPLYAYKDLYLTAVLYVGFLVLCVFGLRAWKAGYEQEQQAVPA